MLVRRTRQRDVQRHERVFTQSLAAANARGRCQFRSRGPRRCSGVAELVRPLRTMTKSQAIQWKTACWIAVGGFTAASAWFGWGMHQMIAESTRPGSMGLMCGNSVTDPLGIILSFGTPVSVAGVVGFAGLAHRGLASRWSVASTGLLALGCTASLLMFGLRFFRESLPGFHLSEIVWWLKPFGG